MAKCIKYWPHFSSGLISSISVKKLLAFLLPEISISLGDFIKILTQIPTGLFPYQRLKIQNYYKYFHI